MTKPQATAKSKDIYKTAMLPSAKEGEQGRLVKTKIHTGAEIRRSTFCPKCGSRTEQFEGVNDSGWIFRRNGTGDLAPNAPDYTHSPHLFTAEPATGIANR